jgi:membrane protein DedA with SNARE-associated domain
MAGGAERGRHYYRPVGAHEIHHLVREYGIVLVFLAVALQAMGPPVPGTTVLIAAAVYAATGGLPIAGVIAAGALGVLVGTTVGYGLGRWGGERLLLVLGGRLRQNAERVQQLRRAFAAHGGVWLLVGRFFTGGRNVMGVLAGSSGMALTRFLAISAVAAFAWTLVTSLEYYFFGHALLAAGTWLKVLLVCAGIAWMVISLGLLRRRALRHLHAAGESGSV